MRDWTLAKFLFDEVIVVEIFVWEFESISCGCVGPTRVFVRAAFRTGFGVARDRYAAVGADFGSHVRKFETRNSKFERSPTEESFHAGVFLVGFEMQAHEDVIVGDRLHVFDVIFEAEEFAEAKEFEHFDSRFLFADEFGFDLFESQTAGERDDFRNERASQPASAVIWQDEHADAADVPFPSAELLVKCGVADDFAVHDREQWEVAVEVNVLAPIVNDFGVLDTVFYEHPLGRGDGGKEFVKCLFVIFAKRTKFGFRAVFQFDVFRIFLQFEFEGHSANRYMVK
jgi:hypothetical protein